MIYNNDEVLKQQIIGEEYFFFFFFFSIYKRIAEKEKKFQYMFRLENYSIYEKKKEIRIRKVHSSLIALIENREKEKRQVSVPEK